MCLMETIQGLSNYELFLMKLQSYIVLCDEPNKKSTHSLLTKDHRRGNGFIDKIAEFKLQPNWVVSFTSLLQHNAITWKDM